MATIKYYLENLDKLLIDKRFSLNKGAYFSLLFSELPTLDEIQFRTAKLAEYIALKDAVLATSGIKSEPDRSRTGDLFRDREAC